MIALFKSIFARGKNIIFKPGDTWKAIKTEETTVWDLFKNYLMFWAAVPALASIIGWSLIGYNVPPFIHFRVPLGGALVTAVLMYAFTLGAAWVGGQVISLLAGLFGAERNDVNGMKVSVYSYTPMLAAGILYIFPALQILVMLAGLYGLYLIYFGLPVIMGSPKEKSLAYCITIIIIMIIINIIIGTVISGVLKVFGPSVL